MIPLWPVTVEDKTDCRQKRGSTESNPTGWSDHKFQTSQVLVRSHTPCLQLPFLHKKLIFALSKSYPLCLAPRLAHLWSAPVQTPPSNSAHPHGSSQSWLSCNPSPALLSATSLWPSLPPLLNPKCIKETAKCYSPKHFPQSVEISLPGLYPPFDSNKC